MSTRTIKAAVALDGVSDHEAVRFAVQKDPSVEVAAWANAHVEELGALNEVVSDVLVVACSNDSDDALRYIKAAVEQRPARPVIAFVEGSPNGFVQRAFDVGADDLVAFPVGAGEYTLCLAAEQIAFAAHKAVARRAGSVAATGQGEGQIIAMLGPKGGTGKTLSTCNLAAALADVGKRVVVVDLDLQFGDVGLALGLKPEKTLYDLATSGGALDAEKLEAFYATHPSGVRVLMAPTRPDQAQAVTIEFLRRLYATLRTTTDYVLVDTPPGFTPEVIASIDASSQICMVAMLDALSLKNSKLGLETLELMGYSRDRIRVVLNRADSKVGVTPDDAALLLGWAPDVFVPSHRDVTRSVNEAMPVVLSSRNSDAAAAFRTLAGFYLPPKPAAEKRRRLFGGLRRRRRGDHATAPAVAAVEA